MPPQPSAVSHMPTYHVPITNTMNATESTIAKNGNEQKETVIIFDWDDTLLCSSFLSSRGLRLDTDRAKVQEVEAQLKELEQSVIAVLSLALTYGNVHVVTNAETGWVQLSAQKFLPGVVPMLSKVTVTSARSSYEAMFPDSPLKWKYYAFQERLAAITAASTKKEKNVLSFGDSHVEREAVRAVTRGMPATRTKSVKFAERPSMEQLRRQIELVTNCFQYIHNHEGDLDLQLTVTVNNNQNAAQQQQQQAEKTPFNASSLAQNSNPLTTTEEKPM